MEKHYDFKTAEPAMQALWETEQTYAFNPEQDGEVFSIDTPPPTVSGALHVGHVFSYVEAEIIARYRRMTGHKVFYPFGFDDNGLPTERLVERETGMRAKDQPRDAFIRRCADTSAHYVDEYRRLWQRMGFSVDWSLQYETSGSRAVGISQRCFLELARAGKAYRKESPVLWCVECQSSIAQAELETREAQTHFYRLRFTVDGVDLPVATTRPELLHGCVCLFVHPKDERYAALAGRKAAVPLYGLEIPVYTNSEVDRETGTGVVMCATYGDAADVRWAAAYDLPYRRVINANGTVDERVPHIGGLPLVEAREKIVSLLNERGFIVASEPLAHRIGVHERCGTPVEFLPSRQWYIDVLSDKEKYLQAASTINWYPASMKVRYISWVENLQWDWCISRQRHYGVPIPVWYCEDCGEPYFPPDTDLPVDPQKTNPGVRCACGGGRFLPETSVLDTWATSSLTPLINAQSGGGYPMTLRTQAHEIIRTWAFYSIVRALYHTEQVPWRDIMVCGFVLAKPGEKLSKSKNNASASPLALIETYSADALRYASASARLGTDTYFDEDELKTAGRFLTKLWNACRFALPLLADFDPEQHLDENERLPIDRWLLMRANQTFRSARQWLDAYETGAARREIDLFFWNDFCDFYIEMVKTRLYEPDRQGRAAHRSGQFALYRALLSLLKLYAPFAPHITEYIYRNGFPNATGSLHRLKWDTLPCEAAEPDVDPDDSITGFGEACKEAVASARKLRSENRLPRKVLIDYVQIRIHFGWRAWLAQTEGDLLACAGAEKIDIFVK